MTHSRASNQGLAAAAPDRDKRRREDAADDASLFAAEIEQIQVLRTRGKALQKGTSVEGRRLLASTNSQLEQAFSRAEALSKKMALESMTPPYAEKLW